MSITARVMGPQTRTRDVLSDERSAAALRHTISGGALAPDRVEPWLDRPVSLLVAVNGASSQAQQRLWVELAAVPRPRRHYPPSISPRDDVEPDDVAVGSATVTAPVTAGVNAPVEVTLAGPSQGNPFIDVELTATFISPTAGTVRVGGFYDGGGSYLIRFLPPAPGPWEMTTNSTARSLDQIHHTLLVEPSDNRGPVRVFENTHFAYDNGEPYVPIGTTAYAWTHQDDTLEEQTLATLASAPFTKLWMCLFPKHFLYNDNDPRWFPFEPDGDSFDHTRFNIDYFRHLEHRLQQLADLGIEADLILFHPYDRWGFMDLGPAVDERYVRYVVRRLAAFPHVWWSLANEYDFIWTKDLDDWERIAAVITDEDHAQHLTSIHNGLYLYDYSASWATHCSIQKVDAERVAEVISEWRLRWGKPVIFDEPGYEGDLEYDWGNLTAPEMTRRFWEATVRGGYLTHGETYWSADDHVFWSKGGRFVGDSVERIAFLATIIAASPTNRMAPITTGLAGTSGGAPGLYEVHYFGAMQPRTKTVPVPPGEHAYIDVIDTWAMTIHTLPGLRHGEVTVPLPAKPYMAVRVRVHRKPPFQTSLS